MLWYGILTLLLVCGIDSQAQAPVFIGHPVSISTIEGSVVEFTCIANNNPTSVVFLVNGSATGVDPNKGFNEQPAVIIDSNTISRSLLVTVSVADNDNSMIRCQASNADAMGANSDTAILRVQGSLSPVASGNLSYSVISCYSINISWIPPFTLPGTNITGYNISATSNGTTTNYFTSNSYYELSLIDPFNENIVNISGYNGLDGEVTPLYIIRPPARYVSFSLNIIIDQNLNISLNFIVPEATTICLYQYPTSLEYRLFHDDHLISNNTLSYADVVDIDSPLNITKNEEYAIVVSFTNELAPELYQYNIINTTFNTYDLVSVRDLNSSHSQVCLECSFSSFSTDNAGCTVELTNSTLTYNETFFKPSDGSSIAIGCIYGISPGQYSITVYGKNGPPVLISELNVTGTPMENITTSTTTTTTASITDTSSTSPTNATDSSGRLSETVIIISLLLLLLLLS